MGQEILQLLQKLIILCHVQNSPLLNPVLSQTSYTPLKNNKGIP